MRPAILRALPTPEFGLLTMPMAPAGSGGIAAIIASARSRRSGLSGSGQEPEHPDHVGRRCDPPVSLLVLVEPDDRRQARKPGVRVKQQVPDPLRLVASLVRAAD